MVVCPTTPALQFSNVELQFAMRLRLGLAALYAGEDTHGYQAMATSFGGRSSLKQGAMYQTIMSRGLLRGPMYQCQVTTNDAWI